MKKIRNMSLVVFALLGLATPAYLQTETQTKPATPSNKYAENDLATLLQLSAEHKNLYEMLAAEGMLDVLKEAGPVTVFVPQDAALAKIKTEKANDMKKANSQKDFLVSVLKYHMIKGTYSAADIMKIADRNGKAELTTLQGQKLYAAADAAGNIYIMDESGGKYKVTAADKGASNGILHVIDGVLLPKNPSL